MSKLRKQSLPSVLAATLVVGTVAGFGSAALAASDVAALAPLDSIAMPVPSDNKQTDAKIALGKQLFFDPRLGGDASVSCSSCHDPEQGWAWRKISPAVIRVRFTGVTARPSLTLSSWDVNFGQVPQHPVKSRRLRRPKVVLPVTVKMTSCKHGWR